MVHMSRVGSSFLQHWVPLCTLVSSSAFQKMGFSKSKVQGSLSPVQNTLFLKHYLPRDKARKPVQ